MIFVCSYKAKYGGNFLASFKYLANRLAEKNIEVYFVFPKEAKSQKWEVDLSRFNVVYSEFNDQKLVNTIKCCLADTDFAIVHLNFLSSLLLLKLRRKIGEQANFVFHQHMSVNFGLKQIVKGVILRIFGPKNTIYIGVSPEVYSEVSKEVGKKRSRLVLNAIDTGRLKTVNKFNNSNILIFGTNFWGKGVDLAIKAIQHSKIEGKCNLVIVTHNIEEAHNFILKEFNEIPDFVQIKSPVQDITELYSNAFLFLSPSRQEAFGYAVVEAAYSGNQVIISNIPGQNILSSIPGVKAFQSKNVNVLRSKIVGAYEHKHDSREYINEVACRYITKYFSLRNWADHILMIYESLIN